MKRHAERYKHANDAYNRWRELEHRLQCHSDMEGYITNSVWKGIPHVLAVFRDSPSTFFAGAGDIVTDQIPQEVWDALEYRHALYRTAGPGRFVAHHEDEKRRAEEQMRPNN